jgi:hypothetical protein
VVDATEHLAHRRRRRGDPEFVAGAHHVGDGGEPAAEATGRVVSGEVLGREAAFFQERERDRVAEREHDGRAGTRGERQRAGLADRAVHERDVGAACQGSVRVAGHAHECGGELAEGADQADDFVRLAAVRQEERHVVGVDHAEVAVDRAGGVEAVGAGAGRIESAGDLRPHVGRLADADDRNTAATVKELIDDGEE